MVVGATPTALKSKGRVETKVILFGVGRNGVPKSDLNLSPKVIGRGDERALETVSTLGVVYLKGL